MSVTQWAKWFGIVLLVLGILGFVPGITNDGMLLGIFMVDGMHNLVHLVTGLIALLVMKKGEGASKTFFKVFGVIYLLVLVLGLLSGSALGMPVNMADNLLHLVIAAIALWQGFGGRRSMGMPSAPQM